MDRSTSTLKTCEERRSGTVLEGTTSDSAECSVLQYFCGLSDDREILSAEANNTNHPKLSQQKKRYHDNRHCLHSDFFDEKDCVLIEHSDEVIDIALDIASMLEEKHPSIRPHISMHLMKKYFSAEIHHQKCRDHSKCNSH